MSTYWRFVCDRWNEISEGISKEYIFTITFSTQATLVSLPLIPDINKYGAKNTNISEAFE
jgi:hypothetical protein